MDETALRSLIGSLNQHLSSLEWWSYFWTWLVVIGCACELVFIIRVYRSERDVWYVAQTHGHSLPERPSTVILILELLSVACVVVGIAGELRIDMLSGRLETQLREANGQLVFLLEKEAGVAKDSADKAKAAAASALAQSGQAQANSREAEMAAKSADAQASMAQDTVTILGKQMKSINSELADAQSFLSEREILDPTALKKDLSKFSKKPIFFRSYTNDGDGYFVCKGLVFIASDAGVQAYDECGKYPLENPHPIWGIHVVSPDDDTMHLLGGVMGGATRYGSGTGVMGGGQHSPITVVFIGRKPVGKASITTKPGEIVDTTTVTF